MRSLGRKRLGIKSIRTRAGVNIRQAERVVKKKKKERKKQLDQVLSLLPTQSKNLAEGLINAESKYRYKIKDNNEDKITITKRFKENYSTGLDIINNITENIEFDIIKDFEIIKIFVISNKKSFLVIEEMINKHIEIRIIYCKNEESFQEGLNYISA